MIAAFLLSLDSVGLKSVSRNKAQGCARPAPAGPSRDMAPSIFLKPVTATCHFSISSIPHGAARRSRKRTRLVRAGLALTLGLFPRYGTRAGQARMRRANCLLREQEFSVLHCRVIVLGEQ